MRTINLTTQPFYYLHIRSIPGYFDTDKFLDNPVVDKIKHKDFDTTEGNIITQVFAKEFYRGKLGFVRGYILFYTKDSIIQNFWKNVQPYTL